jgi:hypothetical protein
MDCQPSPSTTWLVLWAGLDLLCVMSDRAHVEPNHAGRVSSHLSEIFTITSQPAQRRPLPASLPAPVLSAASLAYATCSHSEPGRSRRKTPRRVARIASLRHRCSTTRRLATGSAGWASGRPAVHVLFSGFSSSFSLRCSGCAPHRSLQVQELLEEVPNLCTLLQRRLPLPPLPQRVHGSAAAPLLRIMLCFFLLFLMISSHMRCDAPLILPGPVDQIGRRTTGTRSAGAPSNRFAWSSFVVLYCAPDIVLALFHSLTSS